MWLCVDACIRGITVHVGGVGVKVTRPSTLESRWAAPRVHIAPLAVRPEYLLYTSAHWARGGVKQYWGGRRSDVVPKRDQAPTNDLKNAPKAFPKRSRPRPWSWSIPRSIPEVYPEVYQKGPGRGQGPFQTFSEAFRGRGTQRQPKAPGGTQMRPGVSGWDSLYSHLLILIGICWYMFIFVYICW